MPKSNVKIPLVSGVYTALYDTPSGFWEGDESKRLESGTLRIVKGSPEGRVKGSLWHYPAFDEAQVEWIDNHEFEADLKLVNMQRGRSAAYFLLEAEDKRLFPMFMVDFYNLCVEFGIQGGAPLTRRWTFAKRGTNFGIMAVKGIQ